MISEPKKIQISDLAINIADKCQERCRHVTIILYKNRIISIGLNSGKTNTNAAKFYSYPSIHSELDALRKAPKKYNLRKCVLVNFRISREPDKQTFLMSRPCSSCMKTIESYGITKVMYTNNRGQLEKLK